MKYNFNIIKKAVLGLLIASSMAGCDSVFDITDESIIGGSSFWKTEEDVKSATQGLYTYLRSCDGTLFVLGELRSETAGPNSRGAGGGLEMYYRNTLTPATIEANWHVFYQLVNFANCIIKYGGNVKFEVEANKNYYLAQAYISRAWAYFVMTRAWGDLIIRTEPVEGNAPDLIYKKRSPKEEVMALIKSDIDKAIELFGTHESSGAAASGRIYWNKPAALALKADAYLWSAKVLGGGEADLRTALAATEQITSMTADDYIELTSDYAKIFDYNNKFNGELLFCLNYQKNEAENNFYSNCWCHQGDVPLHIDEETDAILNPCSGQGIATPTPELRNAFDADDTRKAGTLFEVYAIEEDGSRTYNTSIVLKGKGMVENGKRYYMNHVILYRYADVILMRAEAKNALGMDPTEEINMIRERAYGDKFEEHKFTAGSKEYNDEVILEERLKEFSFECKRWFDLVRFDKVFDKVPSLKDKKGQDYLKRFPISLGTISVEHLVEQNPGWGNN